jgi:hypothetical protein
MRVIYLQTTCFWHTNAYSATFGVDFKTLTLESYQVGRLSSAAGSFVFSKFVKTGGINGLNNGWGSLVEATSVSAGTLADAESQLVPVEPEHKKHIYKISDNDRELVELATAPADLPVAVRNKLYMAINRAFTAAKDDKVFIPPAVIARYDEASATRGNWFFITSAVFY